MSLDAKFINTVVFVYEDRDAGRTPIGSAFMIAVAHDGGFAYYAVTARHVVEHQRPTWLRLRRLWPVPETSDNPPLAEDPLVAEWLPHPTADVAVAAVDWDDLATGNTNWIFDEVFADRWSHKPNAPIAAGDTAFLIGLLSDVHAMVEHNIPMVRGGTVGAMYQSNIPVRQANMRRIEPRAHLIDVHSRSGFSGAPCIIAKPSVDVGSAAIFFHFSLIGVVIGHFESYADVVSRHGDDENYETDFRVQDNQGVAVVTPIEAVRELLDSEELVKERTQRVASAKDKAAGI